MNIYTSEVEYLRDKVKALEEALAKKEQGDHFDCGTYVGSHIGKEIRHSIGDDLPAHKPWVGLTNKELADCWDTIPERAMKRVEAKLKEKNT